MAGENSSINKYEYLDHTADVQIHAWGDSLQETFENAAIAMTAYITDISKIEVVKKEEVVVEAHDLYSLFFKFLDEVLYLFNAEQNFLSKRVRILELVTDSANDRFSLKAECYGETFSFEKHPQGTEIKAITYSAMKIVDCYECHEAYFIVDI